MTTFEQLSAVHQTRPFEAFTLELADGSRVGVSHPELLLPARNGRSVAIGGPDDSFKIVDVARIAAIHLGRMETLS
ncbi:MAG: hypothetical protein AB1716_08910 [Planctomycetota bacterium]